MELLDIVQRREFLELSSLAFALSLGPRGRARAAVADRISAAGESSVGLGTAHVRFLDAFADTLIPATETPGALAAGVTQFLDTLYREWLWPKERSDFAAGIEKLDAQCLGSTGRALRDNDPSARLQVLKAWDRDSAAVPEEHAKPGFYKQLRALALIGYYTSQVGQNEELRVQFGGGSDRPGGPVFGAVPFKM
jgi:hypothetical protein